MPRYPVRRAQLIAPFGVGAMMVSTQGVSLICCGLDHWFPSEASRPVNLTDFLVPEWRLERRLGVEELRLPPDFRESDRSSSERLANTWLKVPFLRFPQWHVCPSCGALEHLPLHHRGPTDCPRPRHDGASKKWRPKLVQVRFVAICEKGHLQDFPWREWLHRDESTNCQGALTLSSAGGSDLGSLWVNCECGARRSLSGITSGGGGTSPDSASGDPGETHLPVLSGTLNSSGDPYLCRGTRPWHGETRPTSLGCGHPLVGSLRGATNLHYANVVSSIFLPRDQDRDVERIIAILESPGVRNGIRMAREVGIEFTAAQAKMFANGQLNGYSDERVERAMAQLTDDGPDDVGERTEDVDEVSFRRQEHAMLRKERTGDDLIVRPEVLTAGAASTLPGVSRLCAVEKLRETRVMTGFSRLRPDTGSSRREVNEPLLWKKLPTDRRWLPAYVTNGEGIYLELDEALVRQWERRESVQERFSRLRRNQAIAHRRRAGTTDVEDGEVVTPRFVLLHTLSHLLMNRLVFECGYSSAALRERLYASDDPNMPMASVLIYTASGDSEGTMGGLVRMSRPDRFAQVLADAISEARWCGSDPVCMELGRSGQGPDSCNLAACHNCSLVPETSCESFNRYLDRWTIVGEVTGDGSEGFFSSL